LVVASIRQATGNFRLAFLSVIVFVVIGFGLLIRVNVDKAIEERNEVDLENKSDTEN
jgi:MFS-type transporter involved in bile tolerance (Atg22 family)